MLVPMVVVIILGFIDCSQAVLSVALLSIAIGMFGCVIGAGFMVNLNDIGGKNYSGVLYGISNTFGTLPGIISPYFVGLMTPQVEYLV
jgi:ACS family sodium-dependent inorganic phosphate cotransporter-like MFS transporter 5